MAIPLSKTAFFSSLRSRSQVLSSLLPSPFSLLNPLLHSLKGRNNSHLSYSFSSWLQGEAPFHLPRRGYHVDLGAREKALLEEDPALKRFKSYKNTVKRVSKIGDALTILVVAACSYEIYSVATTRKEKRQHD